MKAVGIDPGLRGAIAVFDDMRLVTLICCPIITSKGKSAYNEPAMAEFLKFYCRDAQIVMLEKSTAMPKQGVTSMFNFGVGFGLWKGMCAALEIPYDLVAPQRWQKVMLPPHPKGGAKAAAVIAANRLVPALRLKKSEDGQADAVLLAAYAYKTWGRE